MIAACIVLASVPAPDSRNEGPEGLGDGTTDEEKLVSTWKLCGAASSHTVANTLHAMFGRGPLSQMFGDDFLQDPFFRDLNHLFGTTGFPDTARQFIKWPIAKLVL